MERGGSVVECRTPEREVRGSRPTSAVLCPWARHFTPRKYWLITQEAMAPSRHDWKIVDWDVKPQHNQPFFKFYVIVTLQWCQPNNKVMWHPIQSMQNEFMWSFCLYPTHGWDNMGEIRILPPAKPLISLSAMQEKFNLPDCGGFTGYSLAIWPTAYLTILFLSFFLSILHSVMTDHDGRYGCGTKVTFKKNKIK